MAEQNNLFDAPEMMKLFDPNYYMEQMNQMLKQYQMPQMDTKALIKAQLKNVEAMVAAHCTLVENAGELMQRQLELVKDVMEEVNKKTRELSKAEAGDLPAHHLELIAAIYEHMSVNMREISKGMRAAQEASMQKLDERFRESLKELNGIAEKKAA
ncbi:phasin family protein [Ectothiorhodospira lacustris]|uniref:phasin family protein n=1 Tax=Ectothiorhodospira lacustris TaxID=2899127 RepID=UPI001EE82D61|nr:phasin family protein [Ectothiorhodospira lacustris]MCG5510235.1 phasin family protein [Ectothiorhodospira lacustris]MCG5521898.1 phasin family protein [Ectothiorhodospira lacustris]